MTELLQVASRSGRFIDKLMGVLWRTVDRFLVADPHAERSLGELRQLLVERDNDAVCFVAAAIDVMLQVRAGALDEAERLAEACAGHGKRIGDADADAWHGAQLLSIRWYQGRDVELLPLLVDLASSTTLGAADGAFDAAVAAVAAHAGDRRRAAGALGRVVGSDVSHLPRRSTWLVCLNGVVEAAHLLEDASVAAHAYRLLEPYAGLPMTASLAVTCFGSVHHALGVASLTVGDVSRGVRHLEAAVRKNTALGHWPAVVASRTKLAEALRLRGDRGDAERSWSLLAEAREDAADLNLALPPSPSPSHRGPSAPAAIRFRRRGRLWQVSSGTRAALVADVRGMSYLAILLAHPSRDVLALELASPAAARPHASVQPVLDPAARGAYRARITRLRQELLAVDHADRSRSVAISTRSVGSRRSSAPRRACSGGAERSPTTKSVLGWRWAKRSTGRSAGWRTPTRSSAPCCAPASRPAGAAATCRRGPRASTVRMTGLSVIRTMNRRSDRRHGGHFRTVRESARSCRRG